MQPGGWTAWRSTTPRNTEEDKAELEQLAAEYGLIVTGGTDYHGMNTNTPHPVGTCTTADEQIARIRALAEARKKVKAIPHNSKCRYGERGAADAKPKAQIILDAAKVSAASGGNSEPKQGQRSQSARGFAPRSTMRVPQPDIIEHFGNANAVPQPPKRCLSRQAELCGIA